MQTLKGKYCYLRALEPDDLNFLYELENDESLWELSETQIPFSKHILQNYLNNSHQDIYEAKQLRMVISTYSQEIAGCIDLFDFNPKQKRAGVGIVLLGKHQGKGIGKDVLSAISEFSKLHLNLHQLYAHIIEDNQKSICLFEKSGFIQSGILKDWIFSNGKFKSVFHYYKPL